MGFFGVAVVSLLAPVSHLTLALSQLLTVTDPLTVLGCVRTFMWVKLVRLVTGYVAKRTSGIPPLNSTGIFITSKILNPESISVG